MKIQDTSFNYDKGGHQYAGYRQTDPRIAEYVHIALGTAKTILNVGAGAGSYEPKDRYIVAIEPSRVMRSQRYKQNKVPAIIGTAGYLPFDDNSFDASMAMVTIHHWPDIKKGLKELRRVTKEQVVIMTFDPDALFNFWIADYAPELIEVEKQRFPSINTILRELGGNCEVQQIPIALDCLDGFQEAFYGRPEAFLEKGVRQSQSAWSFLPENIEERAVSQLAADLESGLWDQKYGMLRNTPYFKGALRLIIAYP